MGFVGFLSRVDLPNNQTSTEPAKEKLQQHAARSGTASFSSTELAKPIMQNLMYKAPKQRTNSGKVLTIACIFLSFLKEKACLQSTNQCVKRDLYHVT